MFETKTRPEVERSPAESYEAERDRADRETAVGEDEI
jgi:hypothetical protein